MIHQLLHNAIVQRVFDVFHQAGAKVYLVGGCVRDALMGKESCDFDFATPLAPESVMAIAEKTNGMRGLPTGINHGTVSLIVTVDGKRYSVEVTTFREDVQTDGRHAKVAFGLSMEKDALRRDFTMNALYVDKNGTLYDFTGGVDDIKNQRVRFIGSPDERLQEDVLRLLRFYRFSCLYDSRYKAMLFHEDTPLLSIIKKHIPRLSVLSSARKKDEWLKIIKQIENPTMLWTLINFLHSLGAFSYLFPFDTMGNKDWLIRWGMIPWGTTMMSDKKAGRDLSQCIFISRLLLLLPPQQSFKALHTSLDISKQEYAIYWLFRCLGLKQEHKGNDFFVIAREENPTTCPALWVKKMLFVLKTKENTLWLVYGLFVHGVIEYDSMLTLIELINTTNIPLFPISTHVIMQHNVGLKDKALGDYIHTLTIRWLRLGCPSDYDDTLS